MAEFVLCCAACGREYDGTTAFRLRCDGELDGAHGPALLVARYERRQITLRSELPGIFRFADWLPTGPYYLKTEHGSLGEPLCFRSEALAARLGLKNLYVGFSGYWPERGAHLVTRTFKEFEVQASLVCILQAKMAEPLPPLVVSSAGNTANSYSYYTHLTGLPLYLFVPESGLDNLLLPFDAHPTLIAVDGDYTNAIALAERVAQNCGLTRDGGVLNPGRRGGMGTVLLNAVCHPEQGSQRLFDHYFQAVGSGSGAIAAWEAVQLLLTDGRFGDVATRIHVAQNEPFTPIIRAWRDGIQELHTIPENEAHAQISAVSARVLTNRGPPYSPAGGLRDVLRYSKGNAWSVSNERVFNAARMFYSLEGVDVGPAAAVALEALSQAVAVGAVKPHDYVLLHVTGGGRELQYSEGQVFRAQPSLRVKPGDLESVLSIVGKPMPISTNTMARVLSRYEDLAMRGSVA
jgi:cysteate synthase